MFKVIIIAEWLTNLGGCERFVATLFGGLRALGIDAIVVTPEKHINPEWENLIGKENLLQLKEVSSLDHELLETVEKYKPNIIHAIPYEDMSFKLVTHGINIPVIGTEPSDGSPRCYWWYRGPILLKVINLFSGIHCFSKRAAVNLEKYYGWRGNSSVIPPPVKLDDKLPLWSRKTPSYKFVFVGRLSTEKGLEFLISSWNWIRRKVGPIGLDIYGDGPLRHDLQELVIASGTEKYISLLGKFEKFIDVPLEDYDAMIISSWFEGLPYVFLESLWRGIPVIVSKYSGASDLSNDNNLFIIVEPGVQEEVVSAIDKLYQTYRIKREYSFDRRALVKSRCSVNAVCNSIMNMYNNAIINCSQ